MKHNNKLNFFSVALMYVGTIVGAGFASGREIWQFFGVFGDKGFFGILFVGILFILMGMVTSIVASVLRTSDMGRILSPGGNEKISKLIGYFMALLLFTTIVNLSSAGGALVSQQFGIHRAVGGLIVVILVVATVIGGFDRMSKVFKCVMPVLVTALVVISLCVLTMDLPQGEVQEAVKPSPLAESWWFSPVMYLSYNMLAIVPIVATATHNAKTKKQAVAGSALGGVLLLIIAMLLYFAMRTDSGYAQAMDMPMLALAGKLGTVASFAYTLIMFFTVYSSATGNYYGFTTKLKDDKNKNFKIVFFAILGFLFGLAGFKNIVAYMMPVLGILGMIIVALLIINFFVVFISNFCTDQEKHKYDFPEGVINVTTGRGSASLLFIGTEKTALVDCSMAYCGDQLVEKVKAELNGRPLDYLFASHTHYDHIGALPSLRREWPDLIVCGAEHGQEVLKREGALRGIKKLGDEAAQMYSGGRVKEVSVEGMSIDRVLHDGEVVDLGGKQIVALEAKGHTQCSMTYVVEPMSLMLACESVGVLERKGMCHPAILHSFEEGIKSIRKCRDYGAKRVIVSHYGIVPENYNEKLWELFEREAKIEKETIEKAWEKGMTEDEILQFMTDKYWYEGRSIEQPLEAFQINMINTIRLYKKDKEQGK